MTRCRAALTPLIAVLCFCPPTAAQDRPTAFVGAALETASEAGRIDAGVIVLRDGEIETVGPLEEVEVPDDALVIDADGKTILPGILEPSAPYDVPGASGGGNVRTVVIRGRTFRIGGGGPPRRPTFSRVADVFDPFELDPAPLLRSSLAYVNFRPPGYGQAAVARLSDQRSETALIEPEGRLFISLTNATPTLDVLRNGLKAADRPSRGGRSRGGSSSNSPTAELWKAVAEGDAPLFVSASNAASILYLFEILEDRDKVQILLQASGDAIYQTLDRLEKREGLTLLLEPAIDTIPNTRNRINIPRMVHERGLPFAFTQGGRGLGRLDDSDAPLFAVGYLVETGLPRSAAIEALTRQPARALGLEERLGSLEAGKAASILVFEGDPLDPYSRLETVIIEGRTVHDL